MRVNLPRMNKAEEELVDLSEDEMDGCFVSSPASDGGDYPDDSVKPKPGCHVTKLIHLNHDPQRMKPDVFGDPWMLDSDWNS